MESWKQQIPKVLEQRQGKSSTLSNHYPIPNKAFSRCPLAQTTLFHILNLNKMNHNHSQSMLNSREHLNESTSKQFELVNSLTVTLPGKTAWAQRVTDVQFSLRKLQVKASLILCNQVFRLPIFSRAW